MEGGGTTGNHELFGTQCIPLNNLRRSLTGAGCFQFFSPKFPPEFAFIQDRTGHTIEKKSTNRENQTGTSIGCKYMTLTYVKGYTRYCSVCIDYGFALTG